MGGVHVAWELVQVYRNYTESLIIKSNGDINYSWQDDKITWNYNRYDISIECTYVKYTEFFDEFYVDLLWYSDNYF